VMATQNPIEHEGTYPLPEAQVDRFMMKCRLTYPSRDEERHIMERFARGAETAVAPVLRREDLAAMRRLLDAVYCSEKLGEYILDLVFATRSPSRFDLDLEHQIEYGASPRATICLNRAARAVALLRGRAYATPQDVKDIAHDVLRHRIIVTYEAEAEGLASDDLVAQILNELPVP